MPRCQSPKAFFGELVFRVRANDQVKCIAPYRCVSICIWLVGCTLVASWVLMLFLVRARHTQFHCVHQALSTRWTRRSHANRAHFFRVRFWFYRTLGHARLAREMNTFIFRSVLALSSSDAAAEAAVVQWLPDAAWHWTNKKKKQTKFFVAHKI